MCVCVCVCACVRACVRACLPACVRASMCVSFEICIYPDIIIHQLVTSPFKSIFFSGLFGKNYCRLTTEATIMKIVPNESKSIYAIIILIVASWARNYNVSLKLRKTKVKY